jgi:hypothetical protein
MDKVWLILPDSKERELAKQEWQGGRYRNAAQFTTIEAATEHYTAILLLTTTTTTETVGCDLCQWHVQSIYRRRFVGRF